MGGQQDAIALEGVCRKVFDDRYALKDAQGRQIEQTPEEMWWRVARGIASVEATADLRAQWTQRFYNVLHGFKFVPGGRILSGAGTGHDVTYFNCFVVAVGESPYRGDGCDKPELTSAEARLTFFRALSEMTDIMARSGGVGMNLSALPPKGTPITQPARGLVARPRLTVALSVTHPDVLTFLNEKDSALLAHLDLAVILSDAFRAAVAADASWTFRWASNEPDGPAPVEGPTLPARAVLRRLEHPEGRHLALVDPPQSRIRVHDSREGIVAAAHDAAAARYAGKSVLVDFSALRPQGSHIKTVNGTSSGPVSWMYLFDAVARLDDGVHAHEKGVIHFAEIASTITGKTIQQGGCFAQGTRLSTERGLLPVEVVAGLVESGTALRVQTHQGPRLITHVFRNGEQEVWQVRTRRGYELQVTPEHKMGVLRNGQVATVPLRELGPGDEILVLLGEGATAAQEQALHPVHYERSIMSTTLNEDIVLPPTLGPDLAYFLGYAHGNGSVQVGRKGTWEGEKGLSLSVPLDRPVIAEHLVALARDLFGITASVTPGDGACACVNLYSRLLIEWLRQNGLLKQRAALLLMPDQIRVSPPAVQGAFVAGYFDADGSDRKGKGGYGFDSTSAPMLASLQEVLAHNGILSRLVATERSVDGWNTIYRLTVTGAVFKERLSAFMAVAQKDKHVAGARTEVTYPRSVWDHSHVRPKYARGVWDQVSETISYAALGRVTERLEAEGQVAQADPLRDLLHVVPDAIDRIDEVGTAETFDFEVQGAHMLAGNALYTSNSRRGALMIMLHDDHPDILDFITAKRIDPETRKPVMIEHANMSVCVSDAFMQAVAQDLPWDLHWGGKTVRTVRAQEVWNKICEAAHSTAEPGVVFMQRCQEEANTWYYERINCVNPCGEQPLPPGGVCNLGAMNLAEYVDAAGELQEEQLAHDTAVAIRFLDNVIDVTPYFSDLNREMQQEGTRRTGLGIMGLADMLIKMGLRYGSEASLTAIERACCVIRDAAYRASVALAQEKGAFPRFDVQQYLEGPFIRRLPWDIRKSIGEYGIRNGVLLTVAPTGTTSLLAGVSSGIEPVFSFVTKRQDRLGEHILYHPLAEAWRAAHPGEELPTGPTSPFVDAHGLTPEEHVQVQAVVQRYVDASISKTSNAPQHHTVADVDCLYRLAYDLGCKGVTYYRDGSRDAVLTAVQEPAPSAEAPASMVVVQEAAMAVVEVAEAVLEATRDSQEALTGATWAQQLPPHVREGRLKMRPEEVAGYTRGLQAPEGSVHVTINHDQDGPIEVFVNVGRAGSDLAAMAEAMGRLCSLILRLPSTMTPQQRLAEMAGQLRSIGGGRPVGFGPQRVLSLPDALAKLMEGYLERHGLAPASPVSPPAVAPESALVIAETAMLSAVMAEAWPRPDANGNGRRNTGNLCPQCGSATLVHASGCKHCEGCGHSEC